MYKVNVQDRRLIQLTPKRLSELGLKEPLDMEEWIEKSPGILGEDLLIVARQLVLPSGIRLDLLAIDKKANLVVIELKLDDSGRDVEWQAVKYASYCSSLHSEDIFDIYAQYLQLDSDKAQLRMEEFIDEELANINRKQRIILVAREFHSDVVSAVLWLRDYEIDAECVRLRPFVDTDGDIFITPDIIIPLPEAKNYVKAREARQKEVARSVRSSFSLEKGTFELAELEDRLRLTLRRQSDLTPRLVKLLEILISEDRPYGRDEVKQELFRRGVGLDIGQAGRYLSNLSQFLTKTSNSHLRQVVSFETGGESGETKDNYRVVAGHRELLGKLVTEWNEREQSARS